MNYAQHPMREKLKKYLLDEYKYPNTTHTFYEPEMGETYYKKFPFPDIRVNVLFGGVMEAARFIIGDGLSIDVIINFTAADSIYDYSRKSLYFANFINGKFDFYKYDSGKWNAIDRLPSYVDLIRFRLENPPTNFKVILLKEAVLKNFTVFKNTTLNFSKKLNIITGENGTGKSHLLKVLYTINNTACLRYEPSSIEIDKLTPKYIDFRQFFKTNPSELISNSSQKTGENATGVFSYYGIDERRSFTIEPNGKPSFTNDFAKEIDHVHYIFLPTHDVFSFLPFYGSTDKSADFFYSTRSQLSLLDYLQYNNQYGFIQIEFSDIIEKIETAVNGKIFFDGCSKKFKLQQNDSSCPIDLTADGWKKIGILFILLNNQTICPGCVLLWDEPEANLNPRLIRLVANCIVELAFWGIQVFITTHSLFLMREIELQFSAKNNFQRDDIRYINLLSNGNFECGNDIDDLDSLTALNEALLQADQYLAKEF